MNARTAWTLVTVVAVLALVVAVQGADLPMAGNQIGYEPDQPVRFSHQVHAGDLQIQCLYCHSAAERSRHAGIPSEQVCMNCHRYVPATLAAIREKEEVAAKETERRKEEAKAKGLPAPPAVQPEFVVSPEIAKVYRALGLDDHAQPVAGATPQPIRWVRVHDLPDFAMFDHRSHVTVGVACETCHGPVDTMSRIRQFADLTMGWCVNCHRLNAGKVLRTDRPPVAPPTDCTTCHQ